MNDSLYLRYREAMYAHQFEPALEIIRALAHRNPSSPDTNRELRMTEQKVLEAHLAQLEPLVQVGDATAVLAAVAHIEKLGLTLKPTGETWAQAQVLRCRHQIQSAYAARHAGHWTTAEACLNDIANIRSNYPLVIADSDEAGLNETRVWVDSCRAAKAEAEKFDQEIQHAQRLFTSIQDRLSATAPIATSDLVGAHDELDRQWRAVRAFDRSPPEGMDEQVNQTLSILRSLIAERQRRRRRNTILSAAVVCLLALVGSLFFYVHHEARGAAATLAELESRRDVKRAAEFVRHLRQHPLAIGRTGVLRPKLISAERWLAGEELAQKDWQANLVALRTLAADGFAGSPPEAIENRLMSGRSSLTNLAGDFRPELAATLEEVQSQWTAWQEKERRAREQQFVPRLRTARQQAEKELRYELGVELVRSSLPRLESAVHDLEAPANARLSGLRLSPAVLAEYETLRTQVAAARKEVDGWDDIMTARRRLNSLESYVEMLRRFQKSAFTPAAQAKAASAFLSQRISRNDLLGALLTPPGTPGSGDWVTAERQAQSGFRPSSMVPNESKAFLVLRNNRHIHFVQRCRLIDLEKVGPLSNRVVFAAEALRQDKEYKWSGNIYDPSASPDDLVFRFVLARGYPIKLEALGPAPEAAMYQKIGLDEFIDRETADTYKLTGLELLDRINETKGNPVFRAYLLEQMLDLMAVQADHWGRVWAPSLVEDLAALREVLPRRVRSGEWLVPAVTNGFGAKLDAYFEAAAKRSYQAEAAFLSQLARRAAEFDLTVVGSVDAVGQPDPASVSAEGEWWGWSEASRKPALLFRRTGPGQPLVPLASPMPFSPLLSFRANRRALVEEVAKATAFPAEKLCSTLHWPLLFAPEVPPVDRPSLPFTSNVFR